VSDYTALAFRNKRNSEINRMDGGRRCSRTTNSTRRTTQKVRKPPFVLDQIFKKITSKWSNSQENFTVNTSKNPKHVLIY